MNIDFNHPENAEIPHPEKVNLGSGTLNLACSKKKTVITVVITAFIFGFFAGNLLKYIRQLIDGREEAKAMIYICAAGIFFICGTILSILRGGEKYRWSATGREFTVSRQNRGTTILFYKEVIVVNYEPLLFLHFIKQGYIVTVQTTRGDYEFKYVFPGTKTSQNFEDTPFGKLSQIVDDLRAMSLDEALREREIPSFDKPSIEDAFRDIIRYQNDKEIENNNTRFRF